MKGYNIASTVLGTLQLRSLAIPHSKQQNMHHCIVCEREAQKSVPASEFNKLCGMAHPPPASLDSGQRSLIWAEDSLGRRVGCGRTTFATGQQRWNMAMPPGSHRSKESKSRLRMCREELQRWSQNFET